MKASNLQHPSIMSLPNSHCSFTHHIPHDNPAVRIGGYKTEVAAEEMQGVDGRDMAAENV